MKDYMRLAESLVASGVPPDTIMQTIVMDLVKEGVSESEAIRTIWNLSFNLDGRDALDAENYYMELKLKAGDSSPSVGKDRILDVNQAAEFV